MWILILPTLIWFSQCIDNKIWVGAFQLGGHLKQQKMDTSCSWKFTKIPKNDQFSCLPNHCKKKKHCLHTLHTLQHWYRHVKTAISFLQCIYLLGYGTLENVIPMITLVIIGCPPRGYIQPQHFTKFTSIFRFIWDILLVSNLFLGGSYAFKLYAIHQQFWEHLKVQKFMDQYNFEMIHLKCTIPAIWCIIPVLLCYADSWFNFGIWSSCFKTKAYMEKKTKCDMCIRFYIP